MNITDTLKKEPKQCVVNNELKNFIEEGNVPEMEENTDNHSDTSKYTQSRMMGSDISQQISNLQELLIDENPSLITNVQLSPDTDERLTIHIAEQRKNIMSHRAATRPIKATRIGFIRNPVEIIPSPRMVEYVKEAKRY